MITLKELGFEFVDVSTEYNMYQFKNNNDNVLCIYLNGNHNYYVYNGRETTELKKAIGLKMKEIGERK